MNKLWIAKAWMDFLLILTLAVALGLLGWVFIDFLLPMILLIDWIVFGIIVGVVGIVAGIRMTIWADGYLDAHDEQKRK